LGKSRRVAGLKVEGQRLEFSVYEKRKKVLKSKAGEGVAYLLLFRTWSSILILIGWSIVFA
jgi:hypothetical protein